MTNRSNSNVWADFMDSEYVQSELNKIEKSAQAYSTNMDRNKLYNVDPKNHTELSQSTETMGVSGGGGSLVGSGDSKALYTTKSAPVPGGQEEYADATVEGLEDVASAMMEVAMKAPTGKPLGTQDNMPEKWDGIQAAGKSSKSVKKAQAPHMNPAGAAGMAAAFGKQPGQKLMSEMEMEDVGLEMEDEDHESHEHTHSDDESHDLEALLDELESEGSERGMSLASRKAQTVSLLKELVKIANDLDLQGQHAEASEIDLAIKDEVKTLVSTAKRK